MAWCHAPATCDDAVNVVVDVVVDVTPAIVLLVNPVAGRGRGVARADAAESALSALGPVQRETTRGPGDESRIARDAAAGGARLLVVVGGDGSVSRAAAGLVAVNSRLPLAIISAGTGNDFAKSLGAPVHDIDAMVKRVATCRTFSVDVGFVDDVPFVNAAGFGFDVHVLERMQSPGVLRGTAAYVGTALAALFGYRGIRVRVAQEAMAARLMLVCANGRYFGGAFHIAPNAALDDGNLDIIAIKEVAALQRVALFARAIRGTHIRSPHVDVWQGSELHLAFEHPPMFEVDGELHRARGRAVTVRLRRRLLQVVV